MPHLLHPVHPGRLDPRRLPGWVTAFAALFVASIALRWAAMAAAPLIPEEAYYWMYARHPSLSYYDHPPMVAWVIGLGTAAFGHREFGVRAVGHLLMLAASVLMYRYSRPWYGRRAALLAALALQALPMYFGLGFLATTDAALVCFWTLGLVGVGAALRRPGRAWGWYVAGLGLGGAMLSKYTGVFLAAGAGLALVLHRPWRRHLRTVHPYLALLLAAALFSPVVLWNARHGWASFRFQFVDRFAEEPHGLSARYVLTFAFYQLLTVTPLVLWACGAAYARLLRRPKGQRQWRLLRSPRGLLAACFSLPLLAVMAYKSLRYEVHLNWTLPAFLALFPAAAHEFLVRLRGRRPNERRRRRWAGGFTGTAVACVAINAGFTLYLLALQPRVQWVSGFGPWPKLARLVQEQAERLERDTGREPLVVAGGKYRLASVLAFYRRPLERDVDAADYTTSHWVLSGTGLSYRFWSSRERWRGADCLVVDDDKAESENELAEMRRLFQSVEVVDDPRLRHLGPKKYRIAVCRGLRRRSA